MNKFEIDGVEYPLEPALADKPGWEVKIDGKVVENVGTLTAINPQMGIGFAYSKSPAGLYNQGRMVNRGGAVIVPTFQYLGTYFLALRQVRPLVGSDPILEFPRGQANFGEKPIETAARELLEETGLDISLENLEYMGNANPDTALIHGANVHCWWLQLPEKLVTITNRVPTLRKDIGGNTESRLVEQIKNAEFVREDKFTSVSMMTAWAAGLVKMWDYNPNIGKVSVPYSVD